MDLLTFHKCLADATRLRCVLLIMAKKELCVCELTSATQMSQPKISRHLSLLRQQGFLEDRRQGQWVYYRLSPDLPDWATQHLKNMVQTKTDQLTQDLSQILLANPCC